jgi:tetratricopeptide (TPR) repeat protein
MINILISLAAAVAAYLGADLRLSTPLSVSIGMIVGALFFVLLARRSNKQLEARMRGVEAALGSQDFDGALEQLEASRSIGKWQILVNRMIDGQVGTILYAYKQRVEEARPYLQRTLPQNWHAKAMLAASYYKVRDFETMEKTFEDALKSNKKAAMLWAAFAWCEASRGNRTEAMAILERGMKELPDEDRLKQNLIALQAKKRMNMKDFTPDWWVLHLERPPAQVMPGGRAPGGGRVKTRRMRSR